MILRYIMEEYVKMVLELLVLNFKLLLSLQQYVYDDVLVKSVYLLFGAFSGSIYVVTIIFAFFKFNMNKLSGQGSWKALLESLFYGLLHTTFATALIPSVFLMLSHITFGMLDSYMKLNQYIVTKETLDALVKTNIYDIFLGGQEVFFIYFLFAVLISWCMIKIIMMSIENFGVIFVQTCTFALLVYDTVMNEGVGTMKFFLVVVGTILGQCLMLFFAIVGSVLLFRGGSFILGLSLFWVAPKLPQLMPSYLGSTGKIMQSGKGFQLNVGMLTSAARMGAQAIG